jgi:hypothetical protein
VVVSRLTVILSVSSACVLASCGHGAVLSLAQEKVACVVTSLEGDKVVDPVLEGGELHFMQL